ncbi:MAG TPA: pyridoxal phosphate-dependent aminotransferase [Burkholderiales bacterium]|nr:pyridoxal phosphate-dependent aminotransferase [Burkholderiales bacterium]
MKPEDISENSRVSRRMSDIQPFHVMALLARARELEAQGRSIIHMEIGEPDFPSAQPVIAAGIRALQQGNIHYTPALGLPQLREAIAAFYLKRYGLRISPARIIVTPGASGALLLALGILINPGEKVLMSDPGYPCNRHLVRLIESLPIGIGTDAATGYQLTPELIAKHWDAKTVAVMIASPANPTGTLVGQENMRAIVEKVHALGGRLIADEIYHGLVYQGEAATALSISDEVFVINSFSKYFGMTGWRLGWLVAPETYVREADKLAQNIFLAASTPAQYAALAAFQPETIAILEQRRVEFQRRRDYLLPAVRNLGFDVPINPQGAFYLYADCSRFTKNSEAFSREVLEHAGVAITPGVDFGNYEAKRHVRFAYTTSLENLREGVHRLEAFLRKS